MNLKGFFFISIFILLAALSGVYQANLMQNTDPLIFVFFTSISTTILFLAIKYYKNSLDFMQKIKHNKMSIFYLNTMNLCIWFPYVYALKYLEPALSVVIMNSIGPLFVVIFSKYFKVSARLSLLSKICSIGTFLSLLFIIYIALSNKSAMENKNTFITTIGIALCFLAGISQVFTSLISKELSEKEFSPGDILALRYIFTALASFILLNKNDIISTLIIPNNLFPIMIVSFFGMIIPVYFFQKGVKILDPIFVSILMILEPVIMFIAQLFDERLKISIYSYIGLTFIIIFSLINISEGFYTKRPKKKNGKNSNISK